MTDQELLRLTMEAGYQASIYQAIMLSFIVEMGQDEEEVIKALLGQWVSELEPSLVWQQGEIVGLTAVGHSTIVVRRRP